MSDQPQEGAGKERRVLFDPRFVRGESRRSYRLALILFWSVLLYFACKRYVVSLGIVADRSMLPTLTEGNYFLVNKYIYRFSRPKRGDVVVFRMGTGDAEEEYVKRVIGLSGETIRIRSGTVYLDDQPLNEPYVRKGPVPDFSPYPIAENTYFMMGDNRQESEDSRSFGSVPLKRIEGKISPGKLFPFS